ncbi:hypothetical protein LC593_16775 [Nostoc sp. CHAB 5844]|nr:hypothetical protein [Nostoc sp. CHAB 5844]
MLTSCTVEILGKNFKPSPLLTPVATTEVPSLRVTLKSVANAALTQFRDCRQSRPTDCSPQHTRSSAQEPRQSRGCRETRKGRAGSPCGLNKQTFVIISL